MTEVSEILRARNEDEIDNVVWLRSCEKPADVLTLLGINRILKGALETGKLKHATEQFVDKGNKSTA